MPKIEFSVDFDIDPYSSRVGINTAEIQKPFLQRAGVIDLNHMFQLLPEELAEKSGTYPETDPYYLWTTVFDLCRGAFQGLAIDSEGMETKYQAQHALYPTTSEGLIGAITTTKLFRRLFDIPQLGLRPYYPLPNTHTRGEHAVYTTVNMIRTLQSLADTDAGQLETRLRTDFAAQPFYNPDMSQADVFQLAADLTVLTGMEHDQATPAGGDTLKFLLGLDEEEDLQWLFFGEHETLREEREEFIARIAEWGMNTDHLRFMVECVQGRSGSLIGEMIHPSEGDYLDWDRISYTLLDCQAASMFFPELPQRVLPEQLTAYATRNLQTSLMCGVEALTNHDSMVMGFTIQDLSTGERFPTPSTMLIDPTEDFRLNSAGVLVNTNPDKLAWIAAFRIWMTGGHYTGGKMLGFETKLQRRLAALQEAGMTGDLLTRERLIGMTHSELEDALGRLPDAQLRDLVEEIGRASAGSTFRSKVYDEERDSSDEWAAYPIKIKPGLDSLVDVNATEVSLDKYVAATPNVVSSMLVAEGIRTYQNKQVVIWESDEPIKTFRLPTPW